MSRRRNKQKSGGVKNEAQAILNGTENPGKVSISKSMTGPDESQEAQKAQKVNEGSAPKIEDPEPARADGNAGGKSVDEQEKNPAQSEKSDATSGEDAGDMEREKVSKQQQQAEAKREKKVREFLETSGVQNLAFNEEVDGNALGQDSGRYRVYTVEKGKGKLQLVFKKIDEQGNVIADKKRAQGERAQRGDTIRMNEETIQKLFGGTTAAKEEGGTDAPKSQEDFRRAFGNVTLEKWMVEGGRNASGEERGIFRIDADRYDETIGKVPVRVGKARVRRDGENMAHEVTDVTENMMSEDELKGFLSRSGRLAYTDPSTNGIEYRVHEEAGKKDVKQTTSSQSVEDVTDARVSAELSQEDEEDMKRAEEAMEKSAGIVRKGEEETSNEKDIQNTSEFMGRTAGMSEQDMREIELRSAQRHMEGREPEGEPGADLERQRQEMQTRLGELVAQREKLERELEEGRKQQEGLLVRLFSKKNKIVDWGEYGGELQDKATALEAIKKEEAEIRENLDLEEEEPLLGDMDILRKSDERRDENVEQLEKALEEARNLYARKGGVENEKRYKELLSRYKDALLQNELEETRNPDREEQIILTRWIGVTERNALEDASINASIGERNRSGVARWLTNVFRTYNKLSWKQKIAVGVGFGLVGGGLTALGAPGVVVGSLCAGKSIASSGIGWYDRKYRDSADINLGSSSSILDRRVEAGIRDVYGEGGEMRTDDFLLALDGAIEYTDELVKARNKEESWNRWKSLRAGATIGAVSVAIGRLGGEFLSEYFSGSGHEVMPVGGDGGHESVTFEHASEDAPVSHAEGVAPDASDVGAPSGAETIPEEAAPAVSDDTVSAPLDTEASTSVDTPQNVDTSRSIEGTSTAEAPVEAESSAAEVVESPDTPEAYGVGALSGQEISIHHGSSMQGSIIDYLTSNGMDKSHAGAEASRLWENFLDRYPNDFYLHSDHYITYPDAQISFGSNGEILDIVDSKRAVIGTLMQDVSGGDHAVWENIKSTAYENLSGAARERVDDLLKQASSMGLRVSSDGKDVWHIVAEVSQRYATEKEFSQ